MMNKLTEDSDRERYIMKSGIKPGVIEEILRYARNFGLKKVILFGSRARGDFDRASDIDLAASGGDIKQFSYTMEEKTSTLLRFDVIDLETDLDIGFREQIEAEGILLYTK
jgi:predicted nucleotidyltransferase